MAYAEYLRALLRPLGVYRLDEASFSGAETEALGAGMDALFAEARRAQRESIAATAEDEGLTRLERLFPYLPAADGAAARRSAIGAFMTIGGDSFTPASLSRSLSACGVRAVVAETGTAGLVAVSFPDVTGQPAGYERIREIIAAILPCHLEIRWDLRWFTWGEAASMTWRQAGTMTWMELQSHRVS